MVHWRRVLARPEMGVCQVYSRLSLFSDATRRGGWINATKVIVSLSDTRIGDAPIPCG